MTGDALAIYRHLEVLPPCPARNLPVDPVGPGPSNNGAGMSSGLNGPDKVCAGLHRDKRRLLVLSCIANALTLTLTLLSTQLPLFDASPHVLLPPPPRFSLRHALASAVLRWDAFHFAHIAKDGYVYEHEWAFLPGAPWTMRGFAALGRRFGLQPTGAALGWDDVLLGALFPSTISVLSVQALYDLTMLHFESPSLAFLASLLSLLPSSPVTLRIAGYTETFFTVISYYGMLCCAKRQWFRGTCLFMLASIFRSNGILLCGFVAWGLVVEPLLKLRTLRVGRTLYAAALCTLILAPFGYYQYHAYRLFCIEATAPALWCNAVPPSIYTYVQSKYWNVGFLRYWTLQQLPNFILGAPPLLLLFAISLRYVHLVLYPRLLALRSTPSPRADPSSALKSPFFSPSVAPHAIHALILASLLLFASHTQIVLRTAASMPFTYWAAAWLVVERPTLGRWWVGWSVLWGAVSCVLWGVFLPPA